MLEMPPSRFLNYIAPALRVARPMQPLCVRGPIIDTMGFGAVRVMVLNGPADGEFECLRWQLAESDTPEPDSFMVSIIDDPLYCGVSRRQGLSWACLRLGASAGRRRHIRGDLLQAGDGAIVCGMTLESFAEGQVLSDDFGLIEGVIHRGFNGRSNGVCEGLE